MTRATRQARRRRVKEVRQLVTEARRAGLISGEYAAAWWVDAKYEPERIANALRVRAGGGGG